MPSEGVWGSRWRGAGRLMVVAAFVIYALDMLDLAYGQMVLFGVGGAFVFGIGVLLLGVVLVAAWYASAGRRQAVDRDIAEFEETPN